ncbi:MAG: hypothetical protein MI919_26820 [Holophagales bacterium]|nr:hypothetical protein [Holophagales bacterium]
MKARKSTSDRPLAPCAGEGADLAVVEAKEVERLAAGEQLRHRLALRCLGFEHLLLGGDAVGEQAFHTLGAAPCQLFLGLGPQVGGFRLAELDGADERERLAAAIPNPAGPRLGSGRSKI